MKHYVIITAGGSGKRMGARIPKQFLELDGKPILLRTIELFTNLGFTEGERKRGEEFDVEIILVLPQANIAQWQEFCVANGLWFKHIIVEGGMTRFHSVRAALEYVPDGAVVAVHDGVRPFVPQEMIKTMFRHRFDGEIAGVIPVMPVIESMRRRIYDADGNEISTTSANRDDFILVQTPQVFDSTRLRKAYKKPYSPDFTDDASVMESSGYRFDTVAGSKLNIKITTQDDLLAAKAIISSLKI